MSEWSNPDWIVRIKGNRDWSQADMERLIVRLLSSTEGELSVMSVKRPMQLNPEPLRVRKDTDSI